jgi:hypothetical protein
MTLNITVFSKDFVIQASDRCISIGGVPTGAWNKALVFRSKRLGAVLTYTGIAGELERDLDGMPAPSGTTDFLAERICHAEGARWSLRELANRIRQEADGLFSTLPSEWVDRHTAFTLAGWDSVRGEACGYHIHNCLDDHARKTPVCRSAFVVQAMDRSQPDHYAGISDAVHRRQRKRIREALRSGAPAQRVVQLMVKAVWAASDIQPLISTDCVTILLPPKGNAQARFHGGSPLVYGPTTVVIHDDGGAQVFAGVVAQLPEERSFSVGDDSAGMATQISRGYRRESTRARQ